MNPKAPSVGGAELAADLHARPAPGGDWSDPGSYSADILYTALP